MTNRLCVKFLLVIAVLDITSEESHPNSTNATIAVCRVVKFVVVTVCIGAV
jgi:hypothetical protein